MAKFNFTKVKNPVQELFVSQPKDKDPLTFLLKPIDTAFAFDASRWQSLMGAGRQDDAIEMQFQIGVNRVMGWKDVLDEEGNEVDFVTNYAAFTRIVDAIPYLMDVGKKTLIDLDIIPADTPVLEGNGLGAAKGVMSVEATVIPGVPAPEASETSSETP